jgi:hypothetical protein
VKGFSFGGKKFNSEKIVQTINFLLLTHKLIRAVAVNIIFLKEILQVSIESFRILQSGSL